MRSLGVVEASHVSVVGKKKKTAEIVAKKEKPKVIKAVVKHQKVTSADPKPSYSTKLSEGKPKSTTQPPQSSEDHANYANYVTRKLVKSLDHEAPQTDSAGQPQPKSKPPKVKKPAQSGAKRSEPDTNSAKLSKKATTTSAVHKLAKRERESSSSSSTNGPDDKHPPSGDAVNYVTRTLMKALYKAPPTPNRVHLPIQQSSKERVHPTSPTCERNPKKKPSNVETLGQSETDESMSSPEGKPFSPIKSQITKMIFKTKPKAVPVVNKPVKNEHDSVNYVTRTLLKSLKEPVDKKKKTKIDLPLKESPTVVKKIPPAEVVEESGVNYVTRTLIKNICTSPDSAPSKAESKSSRKSNHLKESPSKKSENREEFKEDFFAQESANYVTRHLVKSISGDPVKPKKKLDLPIKPRVNGKPKDDLVTASLGPVVSQQPTRKRKSSFLASFYDDSDSDDDLRSVSTKANTKKPRVKKSLGVSTNQTDKQSVKSRNSNTVPGVKHGKKWFNLPSAITVDEKFDLFLQNTSSTPTATTVMSSESFSFKNASDTSGDSDGAFDLFDSEPKKPLSAQPRKSNTPKGRSAVTKGAKKINHVSPKPQKVNPSTSRKKPEPKKKKVSTKKPSVPNKSISVPTSAPPKASVAIEEQFESDCAVYVTRRLLKNLPM